ncbi:MAG: TlpA family protein disulfide reductase, partial [Bacteroidaceae bacterium]|nr:TlpA family protein disulfide reductase [Bacteroidaceae bacterium]
TVTYPAYDTCDGWIAINKVELFKKQTVLHGCFYYPTQYYKEAWYQIAGNSAIIANGDTLRLVSADIELDKPIYPDSRISHFTLIFPPVDKHTTQMDFHEHFGPNEFFVTGIDLTKSHDGVAPYKSLIPGDILASAGGWDESGDTLQTPEYRVGRTQVRGHVYGLRPGQEYAVQVILLGILDGRLTEVSAFADGNGDFSLDIPLSQTHTPALLCLNENDRHDRSVRTIFLEDGNAAEVYIDAAADSHKIDFSPEHNRAMNLRDLVFKGGMADVNNAFITVSGMQIPDDAYIMNRGITDLFAIDDEYQQAYMDWVEEVVAKINAMNNISPRAKKIAEIDLRTLITKVLAQNSYAKEREYSEAGKQFWIPRSTFKLVKDGKWFPKDNTLMYSSSMCDLGNQVNMSYITDSIIKTAINEELQRQPVDTAEVDKKYKKLYKEWEQEIFGDTTTLFRDIFVRMVCARNIETNTPFEPALIKSLKEYPKKAVVDYYLAVNDSLTARKERLKGTNFSNVYNIPEGSHDILAEICRKHEGKVLMIDIWATWCGPCREAIRNMEPKKAGLKAKGIDFVYIADTSSPEYNWKNMADEIDGDHYRYSEESVKEIFTRFSFHGWPSYLIIGRNGDVKYHHTGCDEPEIIRILLEEADK